MTESVAVFPAVMVWFVGWLLIDVAIAVKFTDAVWPRATFGESLVSVAV